jgi:L-ascorbate metabolism protein UlaG (beta-lactamase superfamily)
MDEWFRENITGDDDSHLTMMDWWESREFNGFTIQFLPVQHWGSRTPWDKMEVLWGAWAVRHPGFSFFFGGDFGYSKDLSDIAQRTGGFDLAAIPIGAYEPRWFMKAFHVNPKEAVQAHLDLKARQSLGIHWGTFEGLTDEALDQPPSDLARAREEAGISEDTFFLLKHGETIRLAP